MSIKKNDFFNEETLAQKVRGTMYFKKKVVVCEPE
jgi:hypothetical protein